MSRSKEIERRRDADIRRQIKKEYESRVNSQISLIIELKEELAKLEKKARELKRENQKLEKSLEEYKQWDKMLGGNLSGRLRILCAGMGLQNNEISPYSVKELEGIIKNVVNFCLNDSAEMAETVKKLETIGLTHEQMKYFGLPSFV